jgi:GntR family transcriptional regulator, phosphonate transport system regulatory protein
MTQPTPVPVLPGSGVALWRQIADAIRSDIVARDLPKGTALPPEQALALHYGVNRHTVRAAIRALREEGIVRAEQGRGTFVEAGKRLSYHLSQRTRLSESLSGQAGAPSGQLLEEAIEAADARVAAALGLVAGAEIVRLETVSRADGVPVSRSTHFAEAHRFHSLGADFARLGSITQALAAAGVHDYLRGSTTVSARQADAEEMQRLELVPGSIVLVSEGLDVEPDGRVVQVVRSRFAAARVELVIAAPKVGRG